MAIIVILCGAPHLYKKDMNNSGLVKKVRFAGITFNFGFIGLNFAGGSS